MREAVLETRVDAGGRALVMFRGAPLQGCSGLEMSAAVTAIAAWARANNGIVRMHTVLPDGSATEDFIHGDGTVVPVVRAAPGRRTARPVTHPASIRQHPAYEQAPAAPAYQAPQQPRPAPVRPVHGYAPAPANPAVPAAPVRSGHPYTPAPSAPAVPAAPVRPDRGYTPPPAMQAAPVRPAPAAPAVPVRPEPFVRLDRAREDPPRVPHRISEAVQIAAEAISPPPHSQASWRAPLDGDEEIIDIESPAAAGSPPLSPLRRNLLRAAAVILLAAAAVLLGFIFLTPGPGAPVAAELQLERTAAVTGTSVPGAAGAGAPMPGNPMLTLAAAGGLAVAAGGAGGLALLKFRRKRSAGEPVPDDDLGEEHGDVPATGTEPVREAGEAEAPADTETGADSSEDEAAGKTPAPLP